MRRILVFAIFLIVTLPTISFAVDESGDEGLWASSSLVYARVLRIRPSEVKDGPDTLVLQPIGTLSGPLDAGLNSEVEAAFFLPHRYRPTAGDALLVWLSTTDMEYQIPPKKKEYIVRDNGYGYLPGPQGIANFFFKIVHGASDRVVGDTLQAIQEQRPQQKSPQPK